MARSAAKKKTKKSTAKAGGNNGNTKKGPEPDAQGPKEARAPKKKNISANINKAEKPAVATKTSSASRPIIDEETHAKYESIKRGELHITDLQKMTVSQLHEVAKKEGFTDYVGLSKQELVLLRQLGLLLKQLSGHKILL